MPRLKETKRFKFCLVVVLTGLIGLSFVPGNIPVYAQAQKALIDLNTSSAKDLESLKGIGPATAKLAPGQKVNLNTATKEQLDALPEIGPVKAQAIIDGRPYKKVEDIMKIKGIKEGTFNKIKGFITVQ
jgi:competence protein ComEA